MTWFRSIRKDVLGELQILACGVFFGFTFVGERKAMIDGMNAYTFNFARYFVSAIVIFILDPFICMIFESKSDEAQKIEAQRLIDCNGDKDKVKRTYIQDLAIWGSLISLVAFGAATLQQIGMEDLSASKTGFITRLQVIVVPLVQWLVPGLGGEMTPTLVIAIVVSLVGLYLLSGCLEEACLSGQFEAGEIWVIGAMICWSLHTIFSVLAARFVDAVTLNYIHFIAVTMLCFIVAISVNLSSFQYPFEEFTDNLWVIIGKEILNNLTYFMYRSFL